MNAKISHRIWGVVLGAVLCLQASAVLADIVPAGNAAVQSQADAERSKVQSFYDRADVKARLQTFGVNNLMATDRVAALSDQEVHAMAQKIDSMPAGGDMGNSNTVLILVIIILVLII